MIITIDIKDSVADKILYFLDQFKNDVKILEKDPESADALDIEEIKEDDGDFKYILEGREARKNGEKTYTIDEMIKEYDAN
jgi:hypothetical protein